MKTRWIQGMIMLALGTIGAGCQPNYDGMRMRVVVGDGDALGRRIEIEQGKAMVISVEPQSSNPFEDYESFNLVELESYNQNIVTVHPADDVDRFVIAGAGIGRASVEVFIDGRSEDILEAEVFAQEVSP